MSDKVMNIIKYILQKYPHKNDLSASRLTKMLYLVDWKSAIEKGCQVTESEWYFNHYGPYVDDFIDMAKKDPAITITKQSTMFGGVKRLLTLSDSDAEYNCESQNIVDFVIDATKGKNYQEFIKLVYSTYPVVASEKYSSLDLVELSRKYQEMKDARSVHV